MEDDLTDMIVDSRECMYERNQTADKSDLTTVYLKGYADAEEKYKKKIKELEDDLYSANCIISDLTDGIPKQKVKEILDKAEVMDYYTLPDVIEDLEELLEDK